MLNRRRQPKLWSGANLGFSVFIIKGIQSSKCLCNLSNHDFFFFVCFIRPNVCGVPIFVELFNNYNHKTHFLVPLNKKFSMCCTKENITAECRNTKEEEKGHRNQLWWSHKITILWSREVHSKAIIHYDYVAINCNPGPHYPGIAGTCPGIRFCTLWCPRYSPGTAWNCGGHFSCKSPGRSLPHTPGHHCRVP